MRRGASFRRIGSRSSAHGRRPRKRQSPQLNFGVWRLPSTLATDTGRLLQPPSIVFIPVSFKATVLQVMIASPGDVAPERTTVREIIHEWNAVHAMERSTVLLPVGWETHASPSMAAPAQQVINKQILEDSDLLIGTFWTRLGTPTATDPSGTAEEIRRHLESGRPAMLYFSDAPVEPSSVNRDQYEALVAFREECKAKGLIETYSSQAEFRAKFTRQLAQVVQREFEVPADSVSLDDLLAAGSRAPQLSREARVLLYHASQDSHGQVMKLHTFGGRHIQTNDKVWPQERNARLEAVWQGALDELVTNGLAEDVSYKGEVFTLTRAGFELADALGEPEGD